MTPTELDYNSSWNCCLYTCAHAVCNIQSEI